MFAPGGGCLLQGGLLLGGLLPGAGCSWGGVSVPGGSGLGGYLVRGEGVSSLGGATPPKIFLKIYIFFSYFYLFFSLFFYFFRHPLPPKQTRAYGQHAASTHPTGMHSC